MDWGHNESYRDKCKSCSHGLYDATVEEQHEDYIRPQENGSHTDCDYVMIEKRKPDCYSSVTQTIFHLMCPIIHRKSWPGRHIIMNWRNQGTPLSVWIMHRMGLVPTVVVLN